MKLFLFPASPPCLPTHPSTSKLMRLIENYKHLPKAQGKRNVKQT